MALICTFAFMFSNLINVHAVDVNVVFLGSAGAGKTVLLGRICGDTFKDDYRSTEMPTSCTLRIGDNNVYMWDIPGEKQFASAAQTYVERSVAIAVIVFDVTNPKSIGDIGKYVETIKTAYEGTPIILVANKADLDLFDMRYATVGNEAEKYNIEYAYAISAKIGEGIEDLKETLFSLVDKTVKAEAKALAEAYAAFNEANDALAKAVTNAAIYEAYDARNEAYYALNEARANATLDEAEANAALDEAEANVALAEANIALAESKFKAEREVADAKYEQYCQLMRRRPMPH
ncbi:MAG: GTP-binding protein [Oscillospiraceae bacterium]|nr:GTP-binding protein [Oscillospiraceae bacterium]